MKLISKNCSKSLTSKESKNSCQGSSLAISLIKNNRSRNKTPATICSHQQNELHLHSDVTCLIPKLK
ncbi:CLUMA_CG020682, isoform A [Clunio marinus]|uniref:CLUMA_CG020682, isoform A n=1 Tax=Clunio marinus TaxID=568069 RepID=A0A1J1J5Q3_9DIPT|nr:CLUMA_CG020682, isoform A [Clunio marinus]